MAIHRLTTSNPVRISSPGRIRGAKYANAPQGAALQHPVGKQSNIVLRRGSAAAALLFSIILTPVIGGYLLGSLFAQSKNGRIDIFSEKLKVSISGGLMGAAPLFFAQGLTASTDPKIAQFSFYLMSICLLGILVGLILGYEITKSSGPKER